VDAFLDSIGAFHWIDRASTFMPDDLSLGTSMEGLVVATSLIGATAFKFYV
jgi:hypothetical protein